MAIERFSKEEFEAALPADKSGKPMWTCLGLMDGEYVYQIEVRGTNKRIVIRSSINSTGIAADTGQDSIRHWIEYYYKNEWFALGKHDTRWTARTKNWREHLVEKLRDLYKAALEDSNGFNGKLSGPAHSSKGAESSPNVKPDLMPVGGVSGVEDDSGDLNEKWIGYKDEFAKLEAKQERKAFEAKAERDIMQFPTPFEIGCPHAPEHEIGIVCAGCGGCYYQDIDDVPGGEQEEVANSLYKAAIKKSGQAKVEPVRTTESVPYCPDCESDMVKRHRRDDGNPFWGCSQFPKCRGTRSFVDVVSDGTPAKPKEFKDTPEQEAIYEAIKDPDGTDLVVEALAGTGKTTTIVRSLKYTRGKVLFCAFNKRIADELRKRAPRHVNCATLHSVGFQCVNKALPTKPVVDSNKKRNIAKELLPFDDDETRHARSVLVKVASLVQATLVDASDRNAVLELINRYSIETNGSEELVLQTLPRLLLIAMERTTVIDYDDMIWLPLVLRLPVEKYDWVFVDEAQDLNKSQLELVMKSVNDHGRVVAVGDRFQSIYGFRGADVDAIPRLIRELNEVKTLPLTISWRCPSSVVGLAQQLVPQFQAAPDAAEGEIEEWLSEYMLLQLVQDGDMILCRINAPLVKVCYSLIKQGKKATIVGRDIGKGLIALIDRLKPWDINDLLVKLNDYKYKEMEKLEKAGRESQAEAIQDKCDTLLALTDGVNDLTTLKARIEKIFTDKIGGISLSSVHRAKGLEADNIYILKPHLMPFPKATKGWEIEQERNIMYVALTRARKRLVFVEGEAPVWYDPSEVEQEFAPRDVLDVVANDLAHPESDVESVIREEKFFGEETNDG